MCVCVCVRVCMYIGPIYVCPRRQFHTLPDLLHSWAALPNSNPNALRAMQGDSLYRFMMVLV